MNILIDNYKEIYGLEKVVTSMLKPTVDHGSLEMVKMLMGYGIELPPAILEAFRVTILD